MAQQLENLPAMHKTWVRSLGQEDSLEKDMATHFPVSLPEKSHGQRSLVGYSPQSCKVSYMPEHARTCMHVVYKQPQKIEIMSLSGAKTSHAYCPV